MYTCPEFVDVAGIQQLMAMAEVDPVSIGHTNDMLSKFRMTAKLLHKHPGDMLTQFDMCVMRHLVETIVA